MEKEKVGDLEEEVREGFNRRPRKDFYGVLGGVLGKKKFLVRFQYGFEKDLRFNQPTLMIV